MEDNSYKCRSGFTVGEFSIYYDDLIPKVQIGDPIVMVHGGAHTGACYMVTPDGRAGWAHNFAHMGYRVIVPDWPGLGRSGYCDLENINGSIVVDALGNLLRDIGVPVTLLVHSMSGPYGFALVDRLRELISNLVAVAPGPPGNIQPIPEVIYEDIERIEVQGVALRWNIKRSGVIGPTDRLISDKLIGASTRFPTRFIDNYKSSLVGLPARLLYERQNVEGSQLKISNTNLFADFGILIITGSSDTDHPQFADAATADWLREIGADVTFDFLDDPATYGNGHMLMLENNSLEIAQRVSKWISSRGKCQVV